MDIGAEWVNRFSGPCAQNELSYCDETSGGFVEGMTSRGHRAVFTWGDDEARERDFRDATLAGDDATVVDDVEFVYFSSHGSTDDDGVFHGYLGSAADDCSWRSDQARYGAALSFLCLDACDGIQIDRDPVATWGPVFQRLHQVFGFTGAVSDTWWTSSRGYLFGRRAGNGEVLADAWLEEAYSAWMDDHPVAMAVGRTAEDAENRLNTETIASGFDAIPNEEITAFRWKWRG